MISYVIAGGEGELAGGPVHLRRRAARAGARETVPQDETNTAAGPQLQRPEFQTL